MDSNLRRGSRERGATRVSPRDRVRVLVAHHANLSGDPIRRILNRTLAFEVVGDTSADAAVISQLRSVEPDLLALSVGDRLQEALELVAEAVRRTRDLRIIVVGNEHGSAAASWAIGAGARAYVVGEHASTDLPVAIRAVMAGQWYVSRSIGDGWPGALREPASVRANLTATRSDSVRR